ncbi:MAG: FeoB-associated Cys-rich membrane protein [Prevotella sp.]|nr:FeoB-associated Cys-rich membrane protein [Prevotella sp.]
MQIILVIIIFSLSVGYAAWRIYRRLTTPSDSCDGCCDCCEKKKNGQKVCQFQKKH